MSVKTDARNATLPDPKKLEQKERCKVSGSKMDDFTHVVANQAIGSMWIAHSDSATIDKQINATLAAMMGIKPQDEIEGMLGAQMIAAHNAAMECYRRAMLKDQSFEGRSEGLNQANKLSRTYATMMEALSRYRGKGQQKVTVEHVHVHAGGQAIVGNVSHPEGGGVQKTEEQPYAKAITHAPAQTMPCQNTEREPVSVPRDA